MPPNFTVATEGSNWSGYIAIDSLVNGTSSGGLRIAHNIDLSEVCLLSREMTLKFSFIGLSRGGAKSGVQMPRNIDPVERRLILEEFGRRTAALIRTGIYYPALDLNCSERICAPSIEGPALALARQRTAPISRRFRSKTQSWPAGKLRQGARSRGPSP